jgi:hypothetical protein
MKHPFLIFADAYGESSGKTDLFELTAMYNVHARFPVKENYASSWA